MIYLASDDSYFSLGVAAIFSAEKKGVTLVDVNLGKEALDKISFTSQDTLLIATEQADIITALLAVTHRHGTRVVLIMDYLFDITSTSIHQGVLNKKMPCSAFFKFLENDFVYLQDLSFLTRQEIKIMRGLTTGKTPQNLSRELNLSVKTICGHKINALKKLGLSHLNARSVLLFGHICHGLPYFRVNKNLSVKC
ncbi:MAG: LuxR C-terminal-related transcriptional regulator [Serratia sp. (in: enterobacteria)]|uniref:LuxR C-terminal-related transcriptional regulator n=1 Tax=Serratia sp. (in: enterobacteria) TaxID=616 RepID=UPI003F397288